MNKSGSKKKKNSKRIHHARTGEDDDPPRKKVKQKLEEVDEEVENADIMMTTLNGLPRSWDYFI